MTTSPDQETIDSSRVRLRRWLVTGPIAARLIAPLLALPLVASFADATETAIGRPQWLIVAFVIVAGAIRTIRRDSPDRRIREEIFDGTRSGVPTGDPEIDRVIEDRLIMATRGGRLMMVLGTVLIVAIFAVPTVAAIRASVWWLAAYAVLPVFVVTFPAESYPDPASARLDRFRLAVFQPTDPTKPD